MRYGTVCSGIEAPSAAWHSLGWQPQWFSEIERFPSALLAHHYPDVPNLGDMETLLERDLEPIELLCGGTPCQSFSVAGLRGGMDDPRGNLAAVFCALAGKLRPRWVVWENVPGVLSSAGGRDFGSILGALAELGYGLAYRVLDAQYFGLAQRRSRVFLVGHLGDWRCAAAVLFERESLRRDSAPRRGEGKVAPTIPSRSTAGDGLGTDFDADGGLITHALTGEGFDASEDGTGRGTPLVPQVAGTMKSCNESGGWSNSADHAAAGYMVPEVSPAIKARDYKGPSSDGDGDGAALVPMCIKGAAIGRAPENGPQYGEILEDGSTYTLNCTEQHAVAFHENQRGEITANETVGALGVGGGKPGQGHPAVAYGFKENMSTPSVGVGVGETLQAENYQAVNYGMSVRRLTPRECERLQGFPDDYTLIPYRNGMAKDGPRYKALGNSIAVPVLAWIGRRIAIMDSRAR